MAIWPCASRGDDIVVFDTAENRQEIACFHSLRQQGQKAKKLPNIALADFIRPMTHQENDFIGGFAVSSGDGIEQKLADYHRDFDDYSSILLKAVADRLAEALAEFAHAKIRREIWGYSPEERLTNDDLIAEKYRGIRPAPGYPSQPDHSEKATLFKLLKAEEIGLKLTETYAMWPTASVSGLYFSHPEAKYFPIGKIGKDQVADYANRKGISIDRAEYLLAPILHY